MPICQKCGNSFPFRIMIDGKQRNLKNRKYCLKCSPFGLHNTKTLIKFDNTRKLTELEQYQNLNRVCKICGRLYLYDRTKGHTKTKCNSCMANERRFAKKQKAIDYKGGKCSKCGYNKCNSALEFHHLDDDQKEFTISSQHCYVWERIQIELDKTILLCANCHREVHEEIEKAKKVIQFSTNA